MTLKNYQIIALANAGVLSSTNHDVDIKDAYKVFKFRKAISKALSAIQEAEKALLEECGIGDPNAFNEQLHTAEGEELAEMRKKVESYNAQHADLYNDDADLGDIKTISYESWFALQKENSAKEINGNTFDIFSGGVEEMLENVLWVAPSED